MKILNVWKTDTKNKLVWFNEDNLVYENRDYQIWKQAKTHTYLYTFENVGILHLIGVDIDMVDALATETRPHGYTDKFTYDRAIENKRRGFEILEGV